MHDDEAQSVRDLKAGIDIGELAENQPTLGSLGDERLILLRQGQEVFATGAVCSHYGGPLEEGFVDGETIRCPWHHARFDLRTGEAIGAPALNPIPCFDVQRQGNRMTIGEKKAQDFRVPCPLNPSSVVIVGAGAAGAACADMLRAKGYEGPVALVGDEEPVDRPNLSKDYLAGTAPEEWIPLRTSEYYESVHIDLIVGDPVTGISLAGREVSLSSGRALPFGALLLATGAEARTLSIPGADLPHVCRLRSLADSRTIIAKAREARTCIVVGGSFIGLEVAGALRNRGIEVAVIEQASIPLGQVLGEGFGRYIQKLHEQHGVRFFLNATPRGIWPDRIELVDGRSIEGALVVLGVGVSPRTSLAEVAGLKVRDGVVVDESLRTGQADVFAAGDVARYPEPFSGEAARIEHWVVAQRQGQSVARSMLGIPAPYRSAPFFWSQHYGTRIAYVGYAPSWDACETQGDAERADACAIYRRNGRIVAVATIGRDRLSLRVEAAMERGDDASVESILLEASSNPNGGPPSIRPAHGT